jgi:hypothetical protein
VSLAEARVTNLERQLEATRSELHRWEHEHSAAISRLLGELAAARHQVADLKREVAANSTGPSDPLYSAVGLNPSAPDFLLKAARTAYRKAFQPDSKPAAQKAAAEAAFKRHEGVFDRIFKGRRL